MSIASYQLDGAGLAVLVDSVRDRAFGPVFRDEVYGHASGEPLWSRADEVADDFLAWVAATEVLPINSETPRARLDLLERDWRKHREAEKGAADAA